MSWKRQGAMTGLHEFRDPIHTFVRLDDVERSVVDSAPVQRLRQIHQLAMTYLVYPGATHRRFEHSLGVAELAGRIFTIVTDSQNIHPELPEPLKSHLLDATKRDQFQYWRSVVRVAALCHDIGHLPFSHAAEGELLPAEWSRHERFTQATVTSGQMDAIWKNPRPRLDSVDVAKLAVGPDHFEGEELNDWEAILSETITGSAFGADRMDYLLRDSLHVGVAYGNFDHARLIDTLRILPQPFAEDGSRSLEPKLGVEIGGLHSAEALVIARYFMFTQVYFHRVRRIYDIHLKDFLKAYLRQRFSSETFPVDLEQFLSLTDSEVLAELNVAARDRDHLGHASADRIINRKHFRLLWEGSPAEEQRNANIGAVILEEAEKEFGADAVRRDNYDEEHPRIDFPVCLSDGSVVAAQSLSEILQSLPAASFDFVFVRPDIVDVARKWLRKNKARFLDQAPTEKG